jgi:hypothetical protein
VSSAVLEDWVPWNSRLVIAWRHRHVRANGREWHQLELELELDAGLTTNDKQPAAGDSEGRASVKIGK